MIVAERAAHVAATVEVPRVLGRLRGDQDGPLLLVVAGLHGNEPAGVEAARRFLAQAADWPLRGNLVALAGNIGGLRAGVRFQQADLNRLWGDEDVARAAAGDTSRSGPEGGEQRALLDELRRAFDEARGPGFAIDLHTTSSRSAPFALFGDSLANRAFARQFPLPLILGLEEQLDGTLLTFLGRCNVVTLGVEGGRHTDASSVDNLEAVLRIAVAACGCVPPRAVRTLPEDRARLLAAAGELPRYMEVRYRHALAPDERFVMRPGFANFEPVTRGAALADDDAGVVRARESGRLLMPLYQGLGDDGFFMTRPVRKRWLTVSARLRRLRIGRFLHLLPGVARHPTRPDTLVVNTRVARLYPLEVFHLFGYRRRRWEGNRLVVSRRREGGAGRPRLPE